MRSRLLPLALVVTAAAAASPRLAAADEAAPSKAGPPAGPVASEPTPLRAYVAAAAVEKRPYSAALVIAGGITAAIGAGGALAGLFLMTVDPSGCEGSSCGASRQSAGRIVLFTGAPVLAAGLVMVIVGIQPAPDDAAQARARLVPSVAVGPTGAALGWTF